MNEFHCTFDVRVLSIDTGVEMHRRHGSISAAADAAAVIHTVTSLAVISRYITRLSRLIFAETCFIFSKHENYLSDDVFKFFHYFSFFVRRKSFALRIFFSETTTSVRNFISFLMPGLWRRLFGSLPR